VYSCDTCHDLVNGPPARNPFGTAFANNGHTWNATLANLDSDSDGANNGAELGDPDGDGTPTPGAQVTNPGDPSSKPLATAPNITTQPASQTVTAGANVTFTVGASGTAPLSYQWRKNGGNIAGATRSSLTLSSVTSSDAGSYTVQVSNSAGSATSTAATLTVNPAAVAPSITTQPASQTVTAGANVTFTAAANGTAPLSYQWRKNGGNIAGATGTSLVLNSVTGSDAGSYTVRVSNSAGSATSATATLTVNPVVIAPSITTQPASQTVTAGANVTFTVGANGTAPLSYQWRKNGGNIAGATGSSLALNNVATTDAGSYTVQVSNSAGSATSATATLTVNALVTVPSITTQPANQTVTAGANVSFTVGASGTAPLSYQWRKNGADLIGATDSSLVRNNVTSTDAGTYAVRVSNAAGSVMSANATLTVNPAPIAPSITTQPASQTVTAGANVTFTVVASGSAPLSYQWRKNGGNIPGATGNSLALNNVATADAGDYTVQVSNSAGSVTSAAATLTVNVAPVVLSIGLVSPTNGASFVAPANVELTAMVSSPSGVTAVDFFDGTNLCGTATEAPYSMMASNLSEGQHLLSAVVTDSEGRMAVSEPVMIMVASTPPTPPSPAPNSIVEIVTPANGETFNAPARIILSAQIDTPRNSVSKVEFFSGSTRLGAGTRLSERDDDERSSNREGGTAYVLVWSRVPAGSYDLRAEVSFRGRRSDSVSSAPVHVTVTGTSGWSREDDDEHDR